MFSVTIKFITLLDRSVSVKPIPRFPNEDSLMLLCKYQLSSPFYWHYEHINRSLLLKKFLVTLLLLGRVKGKINSSEIFYKVSFIGLLSGHMTLS